MEYERSITGKISDPGTTALVPGTELLQFIAHVPLLECRRTEVNCNIYI